MMFVCSKDTNAECLEKKLLGLPKMYLREVGALTPDTTALFLFDMTERKLFGVFEAACQGASNIDPTAWTSATRTPTSLFPSQIRFRTAQEFEPIPDSAFRHVLSDGKRIRTLDRKNVRDLIEIFVKRSRPIGPLQTVPLLAPAPAAEQEQPAVTAAKPNAKRSTTDGPAASQPASAPAAAVVSAPAAAVAAVATSAVSAGAAPPAPVGQKGELEWLPSEQSSIGFATGSAEAVVSSSTSWAAGVNARGSGAETAESAALLQSFPPMEPWQTQQQGNVPNLFDGTIPQPSGPDPFADQLSTASFVFQSAYPSYANNQGLMNPSLAYQALPAQLAAMSMGDNAYGGTDGLMGNTGPGPLPLPFFDAGISGYPDSFAGSSPAVLPIPEFGALSDASGFGALPVSGNEGFAMHYAQAMPQSYAPSGFAFAAQMQPEMFAQPSSGPDLTPMFSFPSAAMDQYIGLPRTDYGFDMMAYSNGNAQ